jgi:hypothetical protein
MLCEISAGQEGRPSKSLKLDEAERVLTAAETSSLEAYIVLSLLLGARTEELRPLPWLMVDEVGNPDSDEPVLPLAYGGTGGWRHEDAKVASHARNAEAVHRSTTEAASSPA